jgi:hypothetical protein
LDFQSGLGGVLLCLGFGHLHGKDLANDSGWMKIGVVWNELQVQVYV